MTDELEDFKQFMQVRGQVARAYVSGDTEPLRHIVAVEHPATFFGPGGGGEHGAKNVMAIYAKDAEHFTAAGETDLEIMQIGAGADIAFWVGFQNAKAFMDGSPHPVEMKLRVTEIFRRENGAWKLVHRHADPLAATKTAKA